jgi:Zn-dependent protease with chaperone function
MITFAELIVAYGKYFNLLVIIGSIFRINMWLLPPLGFDKISSIRIVIPLMGTYLFSLLVRFLLVGGPLYGLHFLVINLVSISSASLNTVQFSLLNQFTANMPAVLPILFGWLLLQLSGFLCTRGLDKHFKLKPNFKGNIISLDEVMEVIEPHLLESINISVRDRLSECFLMESSVSNEDNSCVYGGFWFSFRIILPTNWKTMPPCMFTGILMHELAHTIRKDTEVMVILLTLRKLLNFPILNLIFFPVIKIVDYLTLLDSRPAEVLTDTLSFQMTSAENIGSFFYTKIEGLPAIDSDIFLTEVVTNATSIVAKDGPSAEGPWNIKDSHPTAGQRVIWSSLFVPLDRMHRSMYQDLFVPKVVTDTRGEKKILRVVERLVSKNLSKTEKAYWAYKNIVPILYHRIFVIAAASVFLLWFVNDALESYSYSTSYEFAHQNTNKDAVDDMNKLFEKEKK